MRTALSRIDDALTKLAGFAEGYDAHKAAAKAPDAPRLGVAPSSSWETPSAPPTWASEGTPRLNPGGSTPQAATPAPAPRPAPAPAQRPAPQPPVAPATPAPPAPDADVIKMPAIGQPRGGVPQADGSTRIDYGNGNWAGRAAPAAPRSAPAPQRIDASLGQLAGGAGGNTLNDANFEQQTNWAAKPVGAPAQRVDASLNQLTDANWDQQTAAQPSQHRGGADSYFGDALPPVQAPAPAAQPRRRPSDLSNMSVDEWTAQNAPGVPAPKPAAPPPQPPPVFAAPTKQRSLQPSAEESFQADAARRAAGAGVPRGPQQPEAYGVPMQGTQAERDADAAAVAQRRAGRLASRKQERFSNDLQGITSQGSPTYQQLLARSK